MKTKFLLALAAGAFAAMSVSCKKGDTSPEEAISTNGKNLASMTIRIGSKVATKETIEADADDRIRTVDVFVFDKNSESQSLNMLEIYKKVVLDYAGNNTSVDLNATAGLKNVYVLVNAESSVAASVTNENDLLSAISEFSSNYAGNLIMAGATSAELETGSMNDIDIVCRRIVSKISLQTIQGSFDSPALAAGEFSVNKIYLMNVPKQAKYINGNVSDVFGIQGISALGAGDSGMPTGFTPAADGANTLPYYSFAIPAASKDAANGFYNFYSTATFTYSGGVPISNNASVSTNTCMVPQNGILYPASSNSTHILNAGISFFTYPNCSVESDDETVADNTTKLVLQTTMTIGSTTRTYYYSIGLPYTQPNYHYTINNITIKRLGSEDPSLPVTKAECSFNVEIKDWETGVILGSYNNETSDGNFEF